MSIEFTENRYEQRKANKYIGGRSKKLNGDQFLTGRARYINDLEFTNLAHVAILRSPHPHAIIKKIDIEKALADSKVLTVVTGRDVLEHTNPIPHFIDPSVFGGNTTDLRCLAIDKVIYAGQPVVAVVATTKNDAEKAMDLITIEYEQLPYSLQPGVVIHPPTADKELDFVPNYEGWEDNNVMKIPYVEGDVDAAIEAADFLIEDEIEMHRYAHAPMETRGYIASWNKYDETLDFYGSCQNPHPLRWVLSQSLGLSENKVRVITPKVGGAFGLKMHGHPEESLVCMLSKMLNRPVKWIEDRRESFLIGAREQKHRFQVAFNKDGKVTGLRVFITSNIGVLGGMPGWGMAFLTGLAFPTGYKIPNTDIQVSINTTNKGPWNAARGYGKEATNLLMERVMNMVARELGMDSLEVRRINLITKTEFPYKTNGGLNIDSGDYHGAIDKAVELLGYDEVRQKQKELREQGRYLGVGFAFELTPEGGDIPGTLVGGFDTSTVKMDPSGDVTVLTGVTTPGSGNDTGIAQIVADELGVLIENITVIQGDTGICPYGFGNYSGRSMLVGGGSAALAARDVKARIAVVAAILLETEQENLEFDRGMIYAKDTDASIPVKDVAYTIYTTAFATSFGVSEPALESTKVYKPDNLTHVPDEKGRIQPYPTYSYAVHFAVTEVDTETGSVDLQRIGVIHDCGTIINPTLVEGQMEGAVVMGIGAALSEELIHDEDGTLLTDRFKNYLMPRAGDIPEIEMAHTITPSPFSVLGTKGAGEGGVGGAQAAIANAVDDALAPLGVTVRKMPLSPPNVLQMIKEAASVQEVEVL